MGKTISWKSFDPNEAGIMHPVLYCEASKEIAEHAVSMNTLLAKALIEISEKSRSMQLESVFVKVLQKLPEKPIIKDFDVLFHPNYQVDILAMMVSAYRRCAFDAIWPGNTDGNKLYYAEEGYADYHAYEIAQYDVTVVIRRVKDQTEGSQS